MKSLFAFGVLFFALSFCGLADRFTGGSSDTSDGATPTTDSTDGSDTSSSSSTDDVVKAEVTSDMEALLDGDKATWEEQGIVWKLPKGWPKMSVSKNSFQYGSPSKGFLIGTISSLGENFPTDTSLTAYYNQAVQKAKDGGNEKVQYTEISGVKGVEFVESMPEDKSDARRHQWIGYRKFNDQTQMVNIMVSTKGSNFDKNKEIFKAILYSMEIAN